MRSGRLLSYLKKEKLADMITRYHLLSFVVPLVVIRCHSLSLALPLVITRSTTRCHSLLLVVPLVVTQCHSLSLDVPHVCLFIKNPPSGYFLFYISFSCSNEINKKSSREDTRKIRSSCLSLHLY